VVGVDDSLDEVLRSFLRSIVPDTAEDSVRVFSRELGAVGSAVGRRAVEVTADSPRGW
jgi:hypothetical protein